jgi:phage terminase large subunit GpA-like protein
MFFNSLEELILTSAQGVRSPERLTVPEASEKYRYINNPGSFVGMWENSTTPYLEKPMLALTSALYTGMIFVGPAQSGKTDMFMNWLAHSAICDPADMMLINTAQATARDFSIRRVDRLFRHSKEVGEMLMQGRNAKNVFDKRFTNGMLLNLSWPSINELSGRPIPRLWLTDYDRMSQDVDGEGTPHVLAKARATTFKSHAMTVAESSPGFEITDPQWIASSRHQAPPTKGILSLYNAGDRQRWYWRCVSCFHSFEPEWSLMSWPKSEDIMESAEQAVMNCPHCGQVYGHDETDVPGKNGMNQLFEHGGQAQWVKDGQLWLPDGTVKGRGVRSNTASFWLQGVSATFNSWQSLVEDYLNAEATYESTGEEETLKAVTNTKLGMPYLAKAQASARLAETLKGRAQDLGVKKVPYGVRFLVASIDVQKKRFVVQVHGIFEDGDVSIVDRFDMKYSRRPQLDRPDQLQYINAGAYPEDWRQILTEVMLKTYPLVDGEGSEMAVKMTVCDSGGQEGVTANAYDFVRWLRSGPNDQTDEATISRYGWVPDMAARFQLIKGDGNLASPRVRITYPDSQRKDRHAGARGEIPVMMLNTNTMKNALDKKLDREEPGGQVLFPNWLDMNFYKELTVETKDKKGKWVNINRYRNESWDLLVYCLAAILHNTIQFERIDWNQPPSWAAEWETNDLVFHPETGNKPFEKESKTDYSFGDLGKSLG